MQCVINRQFVMPTLWMASKIFRRLTQGLFVEQSGIKHVKSIMNVNENVVLIPQYRSYADFFVLLYTLAFHDIELPFVVGNMEDAPDIPFINSLFKNSGYIKTRRSRDQSMQESFLTQAVIGEILNSDRLLVMMQNEERIKIGRFTKPTVSDISIEWLLQAF